MARRYKYAPTKEAIAKIKRIFADKISEEHVSAGSEISSAADAEICERLRHAAVPRFRYSMSRYCKYVTAILFLLITAIAFLLLFTSSGTYLSAWFTSIAAAVLLLFVISFPRYLAITDKNLEIHCVLEITEIPLADIRRIHPISRYRLKRHIPVLGSYGFGGFFGYYVDLIHLRIVRMYTTRLDHMIMIQDIYGQRYIVNCRYRELFVEILKERVEQAQAVSPVLEEDDEQVNDDAAYFDREETPGV